MNPAFLHIIIITKTHKLSHNYKCHKVKLKNIQLCSSVSTLFVFSFFQLQAPSVKGFDFAKLHLGQQSKDDVMVIQEPVPPEHVPGPLSIKDDLSTSENGEIPTPISKTSASSTKASRSGRRRERSVVMVV